MNLPNGRWLNNNTEMLSDIMWCKTCAGGLLLNIACFFVMVQSMMKKLILILALMAASPATASCYADYKAKQDNPLRLHYGVIELPDTACTKTAAAAQTAQRIAVDGWTLLQIQSIFQADGLGKRKNDAGQYFLRY